MKSLPLRAPLAFKASAVALAVTMMAMFVFSGEPVEAAPTAASTQQASKQIVVSLSEQQLYAYEGTTLVLTTPVTTGRPEMPTPVGTYTVGWRESPKLFISPFPFGHTYWYAPIYSQYALQFHEPGYFLHDAPWRPDYGPGTNVWHTDSWGRYRTGSLGCVNVPGGAMRTLYFWALPGTTVVIEP